MEDPWQHWLQSRSEEAFRAVVRSHLPLVLATAQRRTDGNAALAQDISQLVFIDLARNAQSLSKGVVLAGWLYRHTCFTAAKAMRTERRRSARERLAMEQASQGQGGGEEDSNLDDILGSLPARDRHALLLRFADGMDLQKVAEALGISRVAAQKRIERAVARLKENLPKALRPRVASAAGLAALLIPASSRTAAAAMAPAVQQMALVAGKTGKAAPLITFFKNLGAMQGAALGVAVAVIVWAVPVAVQVREIRGREAGNEPQIVEKNGVAPNAGRERLTGAEAGKQMAAVFLNRGFSTESAKQALGLLKLVNAGDRLDAVTSMLGALPPGSSHSVSVIEVLKDFGRDAAWRPKNYPDDILTALALMPPNTEPEFDAIVENHPDVDATVRLHRELERRNEASPRDQRSTFVTAAARALAGRSIREAFDFCRSVKPDSTSGALAGLVKGAEVPDQRREVWEALATEGDRKFQRAGLTALTKAAPAAECGAVIDRLPPGTFRNDAATLLARDQIMNEENRQPEVEVNVIADAWLARVPPEGRRVQLQWLWENRTGTTQRSEDLFRRLSTEFSGPDLDALLARWVITLTGIYSHPAPIIEVWERIADPDVRFFAACELVSEWARVFPGTDTKKDAKEWMTQHFTMEQQEVYHLLYGTR